MRMMISLIQSILVKNMKIKFSNHSPILKIDASRSRHVGEEVALLHDALLLLLFERYGALLGRYLVAPEPGLVARRKTVQK